jgi:hypothetical protein
LKGEFVIPAKAGIQTTTLETRSRLAASPRFILSDAAGGVEGPG